MEKKEAGRKRWVVKKGKGMESSSRIVVFSKA